jgi:2-polyprenyl-3-methyl-5-hydroxy-6-metoxy-1,4-benzoquinol methylase
MNNHNLDLGAVPFYWRTKTNINQLPNDIPTVLPFSFSFNEKLQLIIQERKSEVLDTLERVYTENANVGYLQEGHALAQSYGGEFIEFFERATAGLHTQAISVADIGCGGVYLLQELMKRGMNVKGIDPSPVTIEAGRRAGIEIVPDFYPSRLLTQQFNVLIHYDVLEHVEDPVAFLQFHHTNLAPGGGIVFAVPDCTEHIKHGDVSMMLHEHLNYYDEVSLTNVLRAAGFEPQLLEPAKHGGVLLCYAVPAENSNLKVDRIKGDEKFRVFRDKALTALKRFADLAGLEDELGLYVPIRAFPYLGKFRPEARLRFFDDDPGLHSRYYDGFDVAIENFNDLVAHPPKKVIICSLAFGHKIASRLREKKIDTSRIVLWTELFDETLT